MKIVLVVNSIISHKEKITDVVVEKSEFFFLYNGKHKWSVKKFEQDWKEHFIVNFFPDNPDDIIGRNITDIVTSRSWGGGIDNVVSYSTKELDTVEAYETFKELYELLFDKVYGIDDIFNDIIGEDLL